MTFQELFKMKPEKLAAQVVSSKEDKERRRLFSRRLDFYNDDTVYILKQEINNIFTAPEVRKRVTPFVSLASSSSLFKRIVDEISRPVYSVPPARLTDPDKEQEVFAEIAAECKLNEKLDLSVRLTNTCNHAFLLMRYEEELERCLFDVMTPDIVSVILHPSAPLVPYSYMYQTGEDQWVYWDKDETFQFDSSGTVYAGTRKSHNLGRAPIVEIHRREPWLQYWDTKTGADLERAQISVDLLTTLTLKLHKSQGEKQIVISGDIVSVPKGQVLDSESAILIPEGTTLSSVDLQTEPDHYRKTIEGITNAVAANYGLNRDRINAKTTAATDDLGLLERRQDLIKIFWRAEQDLFDVMKLVSRERGTPIGEDTSISVDFGEIHHRVDRLTQLEIRSEERRQGLRSIIDDIMEDNPEITTVEDAWRMFDANVEAESLRIEKQRENNAPKDQDNDGPGQTPEENGSQGPVVREAIKQVLNTEEDENE